MGSLDSPQSSEVCRLGIPLRRRETNVLLIIRLNHIESVLLQNKLAARCKMDRKKTLSAFRATKPALFSDFLKVQNMFNVSGILHPIYFTVFERWFVERTTKPKSGSLAQIHSPHLRLPMTCTRLVHVWCLE